MGKKKIISDIDQNDIEKVNILKDKILKNLENEEVLESLINEFKSLSIPIQSKIIDDFKDIKDVSHGKFIKRIIDESTDKLIIKSAKKIVHILRTKGIIIEDKGIIAPIFTHAENLEERGFSSPIDPFGSRAIYIIKPSLKVIYMFSFIINDREGIKEFYSLETNLKAIKKIEDMIKDNFKLIEIDIDHCKYLIKGAHNINVSLGEPLPDKFLEFKHLMGLDKGIRKIDIETLEFDSSLWKDSNKLFDLDEIKGWLLDTKEIEPYLNKYNEADKSSIIIVPHQKEERLSSIIENAADEIFSSQGKLTLYMRRLEEMGYIFIKSGRNKDGELSYAAAYKLKGDDIKGSKHPFLFELIDRSIKAYINFKNEEEKSRLIISPKDINIPSLKSPLKSHP